MVNNLAVCALQYDIIWEDTQANLKKIEKLLAESPRSHIYLLPEMFNTGFSTNVQGYSEEMTGDTITWMLTKAKEKNALFMGSLMIHNNGQYYNRLIVAFPDGTLLHYDKNYLYSPAGEHKAFTAGTKRLVFAYEGWNICPMICYDLRFPELSRNDKSIDLYCYLANWPTARVLHWSKLLSARAIENQAYVVGLNRIGKDGNNLAYNGMSSMTSFDGREILNMGEKKCIAAAKLDHTALMTYRSQLPFLDDQKK